MNLTIPQQKGVTVFTGAIESMSGDKKDYTYVLSNDYCPGKYAVKALKSGSESETVICLCNKRQTASNIIDRITFLS